jgi:hypothetical protein
VPLLWPGEATSTTVTAVVSAPSIEEAVDPGNMLFLRIRAGSGDTPKLGGLALSTS